MKKKLKMTEGSIKKKINKENKKCQCNKFIKCLYNCGVFDLIIITLLNKNPH